jgi:Ca-activated chloride channel family protein
MISMPQHHLDSAIERRRTMARRFTFTRNGLLIIAFTIASLLSTTATPAFARPRTPQQQNQTRPRQTTQTAPARPTQPASTPVLMPPPPQTPAAKQNPTPTPTPESIPQTDDDEEVINVDTSLINLQVRVVDRQGRPVNDVRKEDFRVFEDNEAQQVAFFSTEEVPVAYGLAIDTSFSLRQQIDKVIEASKTIVESNKPGDETFVITFADNKKIDLLRDFTANKEDLTETLDELFVRPGQTAVLDAVYLAAEHAAAYRSKGESDVRRRALIIVTDGEEKESNYKAEQLFGFLREQGVQIYVIGFVNELEKENGGLIRKSSHDKAVNLINRLAKETGGRAFFPTSVTELPEIANQITRDLRTQYVIGYQPTNKARDGRFRSVRVAVADAPDKNKRIALTRSGYIPGGSGEAKPSPANTTAPPAINIRRKN